MHMHYLQLCTFFLEEAVLLLLVHVAAGQPVVLLLQSLQLSCQLHYLQPAQPLQTFCHLSSLASLALCH